MKVLRSTYWSPELTPTMAVLRESDVTVPLEEISVPTGTYAFVNDDIFEVPDETPWPVIVFEASERANDALIDERNQAILFYYAVAQFRLLRSDGRRRGRLMTMAPAPLSKEQIERVFRQLMNLPQYKGFTLTTTANDGTEVTMKETGR